MNNFYNNENDALQDVPGFMNQNANVPQDNYYNNSHYPVRLDDPQFSGGGADGGSKKPKKEKSPFLTKKVAAVVLTACIATSAFLGFSAGRINNTAGSVTGGSTDNGVVQTAADLNSGEDLSVSQIVEKSANSIVEITTEVTQTNQFMQQVTGEAAGSGVIISEDGYIVTNNHVVEDGSKFTVRLKNGESYEAKLIGRDPQMDLAVLKVEAEGLTPVTFGSSSALEVGDMTVAIGNPLGTLGGTVTNGIVSALNRELNLGDTTMNLIQTNAAINPGNSGGGLFDGQGNLIGVVVAKSGGTNIEGLGFAIPIDDARTVIDSLIADGYVKGRIETGMSFIDIASEQEAALYGLSATGVYVSSVTEGSAAAQIGVKAGDRLVAIDNQEVTSASEANDILDGHAVGDTINITVERSGRTGSADITLSEYVPA
ncbi:MAG: trypsin-like peptidase domain-containing protein [Christensenella sp.]|uniref:S1C family serine protease n=1 Tax=Christensenella sp. TaxID=1935934 RepID=UPI002B2115F8|nr:trypsin-like peptidase domain-containing protein [Christensenella sp.]MEA5003561.1 trypsin-like peptidase domain-containing protein [Christensenella sp.]